MIPRPADSPSGQSKWAVFAIVAIGVFMGTLDGSIVNISLPTIARDFGVPLGGTIEWILIAYLVMTATLLLSAGRLSDMVGRKPVWIAGLTVFTASSALCGAAPSLGFLIASRAAQGVGGALLFATSPALLTSAFPPQERGRALGLNAVIVSLGTSVGPTLGGIITASLTWRWIFYVNVPVGVVGIILTMVVLQEDSGRAAARPPGSAAGESRFDPLGAAALAIGCASLVGALSFGAELGFASPLIICGAAAGIGFLSAVPFIEKRVPQPIIEMSLLRNRVFLSANLSLILSFLALFAVGFIMPFYLEQLRHYSAEVAGLLLTPLPVSIAVIAPISGRIADRTRTTRFLAAGGLLIASIGLVLLGWLGADASPLQIVVRLLVVGCGQAMFQAPNNSALIGSAPPHARGVASGFLATGRVIGQGMSVALTGAVFAGLGGAAAGAALAGAQSDSMTATSVFLTAFRAAFLVCAGIAVVGAAASLIRGPNEHATTHPTR